MSTASQAHFDAIAGDYDYWKEKNSYYYDNLKHLVREFVPVASRVAEIGCGTGDILVSLEPSRGLGIDISAGMVERAKIKHVEKTNLSFAALDIMYDAQPLDYDHIIMIDLLEHLEDPALFFESLSRSTHAGTKILITVANPLWEPILLIAEKLNMKMPEGPHERLSIGATEEIFRKNNFKIIERGRRLLIPKKLPGADWINARFYRWRVFAWLGFIQYWQLQKNG